MNCSASGCPSSWVFESSLILSHQFLNTSIAQAMLYWVFIGTQLWLQNNCHTTNSIEFQNLMPSSCSVLRLKVSKIKVHSLFFNQKQACQPIQLVWNLQLAVITSKCCLEMLGNCVTSNIFHDTSQLDHTYWWAVVNAYTLSNIRFVYSLEILLCVFLIKPW